MNVQSSRIFLKCRNFNIIKQTQINIYVIKNEKGCGNRGNTFTDAPRFVMEVLSPSTENYDRTEKMQLYCEQEIEEYWIVDWRKRTVEIYELDYEGETPKYYLLKTITEENKDELQLLHFPKIKITFDELFDEID